MHKKGVYLLPHTKNRNKKTIKIENPKNRIEKAKRKEKRKPSKKVE
jgi:hypothetical protein